MRQKAPPAGDLNQVVAIQARADASDDGSGGGAVTWAEVYTRWAKVEPLSGHERIQAAAMQSVVSHRVTMRSLNLFGWNIAFQVDAFQTGAFDVTGADLSTSMRFVWKNRVLEISAIVEPPEMRGFIVADCSQVQS